MNDFNFKVANATPRASGLEIGKNVGDIQTTYIYSYKTKYINGKSTGQKTNVDWDMTSSIPGWVSVKYAFEGNNCKVTFTTLQENTGSSARTHTLVMKQRESGKTISFSISQEPNFTYSYYLSVINDSVIVGSQLGNTVNIFVHAYKLRSDGVKIAQSPSVGATPDFANTATVQEYPEKGEHWYKIVVQATLPNTGSSQRTGAILITLGDQRKEVTITQSPGDTTIVVTINWPNGTNTAALFAAGNSPLLDDTISYFLISIVDDTTELRYKRDKGIVTNLSVGGTKYALPGDRVYPYKFNNGRWSTLPSFVLPSSSTTINL